MAFTDEHLTPEVIEDILGMQEGEVRLVLRGLSSLIAFRADEKGEYLGGKVVSNVDVGGPTFYVLGFKIFWWIQIARVHSMSINRNIGTRVP